MFQVVPEACKSLFIFLNSCFFILFQWDVYFSLLFQIVALSPGFLPVTVNSLNILLHIILGIFHLFFFFIFQASSICSVSILITRALNSPSDRLAISSVLSSLSEGLHCFFLFGPYVFVLEHLFSCKGAEPYIFTSARQPLLCCVLPVGEGPTREQCSSPPHL